MHKEDTLENKTLGDYRLLRLLGEGGMGRVYKAEHIHLGVKRAVKIFAAKSDHQEFLRKRFLSEGRILADLRHDRIVKVYDLSIDESTSTPYFAMDLVMSPSGEPKSLAQELEEGNIDEEKIARWFTDICEGLDYIHSAGVVHRDISLDNILIGSDGRIVISDFGISKIVDGEYRKKINMTVTLFAKKGAFCMGKGNYMAPELKSGSEATAASDAWALGVILFRLLTGYWFEKGKPEKTRDLLSGYELPWTPIIERLCSRAPTKRIPEGGLVELSAMLSVKPTPTEWWTRIRENKNLFIAILCLILGGVAIFAIVQYGITDRQGGVETIRLNEQNIPDGKNPLLDNINKNGDDK